jgi:two-component system response regulator DegU
MIAHQDADYSANLFYELQSIFKNFHFITSIDWEAIAFQISNEKPKILFWDFDLPYTKEILPGIMRYFPKLKIIAIFNDSDAHKIFSANNSGTFGFLLKNVEMKSQYLKAAVEAVMNNLKFYQPEISENFIIKSKISLNRGTEFHFKFNTREKQVLKLLANGMTAWQIGEKVNLSRKTVEGIKGKLYLKTRTANAAGLLSLLKAEEID